VRVAAVGEEGHERFLAVHGAVDARPMDLALLRHRFTRDSECLVLVASRDGRDVGAALVRASLGSEDRPYAFAIVVVLPDDRRAGAGTALWTSVSGWARARGKTGLEVLASERDPAGLTFAQARGYVVVERLCDVALDLTTARVQPVSPPAGVRITTLAEHPELARGMYEVDVEAVPDIPAVDPVDAGTYEEWRRHSLDRPGRPLDGAFVALVGDEVVGYAHMTLEPRPGVGRHGMTGVKRAWRGRGIAGALKRAEIAWAIDAGLEVLETENEERNVPIRRLNERLGYRPLPERVVMHGPLAPADRAASS
jgi:GNAT superfamily N-acetyltransferase